MKKLINSIKTKVNSAIISARTAIESTSGEGYIDTGVKIIIGVVIGGVILAKERDVLAMREVKTRVSGRCRTAVALAFEDCVRVG